MSKSTFYNMQSVSSNAVAIALGKYVIKKNGLGYSSNTATSGYYKLFEINGTVQTGNHDVGAFGKIAFALSSDSLLYIYDFTLCARYYNLSYSTAKFVVAPIDKNTKTPPFVATRKILNNGQIIVSVYGQVTANWERFISEIELLFVGDMYPLADLNSSYLTVYTNNWISAIPSGETVITRS